MLELSFPYNHHSLPRHSRPRLRGGKLVPTKVGSGNPAHSDRNLDPRLRGDDRRERGDDRRERGDDSKKRGDILSFAVIPAQAGIQPVQTGTWIPAFAGMTGESGDDRRERGDDCRECGEERKTGTRDRVPLKIYRYSLRIFCMKSLIFLCNSPNRWGVSFFSNSLYSVKLSPNFS